MSDQKIPLDAIVRRALFKSVERADFLRPPHREPGPWCWEGCTAVDSDPMDHHCLMHGGYLYLRADISDPRTRCTAIEAHRREP